MSHFILFYFLDNIMKQFSFVTEQSAFSTLITVSKRQDSVGRSSVEKTKNESVVIQILHVTLFRFVRF